MRFHGMDAGGRGALDGFQRQAVDHDLIGAAGFGRQLGRDHAAQRRGEGRVRAGAKFLVLAADLGARPGDAARETEGSHRDSCRIATTAASAAASVAAGSVPIRMILPPATPLTVPNVSSQRNSPSITGMRQYRRPPIHLEICQPSPK